ncbi:MAG: GGDEF and EAL domain-containing protein [Selenomonadaceae bacterium]|nr:GGDEF and EAL domain-containing protein [Selenomonadaceae bacterium]
MKKISRVPLTPLLKRFKFFFDLVKRTTDAYMFCSDLQNNVVMLSPGMVQEFELPAEVLEDMDSYWSPLIHPEERGFYLATIRDVLEGKNTGEYFREYRVKNRKGEYVWIRATGQVGTDQEGRPAIFVGMMNKMARRNKADEITGLLNKYQFEHSVKMALGEFRATGDGGAVMVFGLDNFKIVNETRNRTVGDMVLKHVAKTVADILPQTLTLYKLDGDEFGLIYPKATEEQVAGLFTAIQGSLAQPTLIGGQNFFCTVSAGTVFYPQSGKDYLVLHKHAEAAMDIAKQDGKNRNCLFSKEQYNRWVRAISLRDSLRASVEAGCAGFQLYFQPQVSARERKLIGAEALLRWQNAKGRMVSPMEFIPILEETRLIIPVGKWILREALVVCKKWRQTQPDFRVSVNLSYEQVRDPGFQEFVVECIKESGLPPEAVILELTESKIVADWNFVNQQFAVFREQGIAIAMDDFGTGYSSLSSLKNLSCDIVKIDREFVKKILESDFDRRLVKYTVELCHSIGLKSCIEGVEGQAEYELLASECGADSIQGYLFGRPEAVPDFEAKFLHGSVMAME